MTIKLAIGSPISMMNELCPLGDIELCFTHLLKENISVYKKYYFDAKAKGRFVILDNGIMELGYSMPIDDLLLIAFELKSDLVTPPEILGDGASTLKLTYEFIKMFEHRKLYPNTKILGVAHGSTFKNWCNTFQELLQIPYIERIGIPYHIPFDVFTKNTNGDNKLKNLVTRRIELCNWIAENHPTARIHLFGLAHPGELALQTKHTFIKSIDTSLPIMAAIKNIKYELSDLGPYEKKTLNIKSPYNQSVIKRATYNINVMKRILQSNRIE
ncbi:MAG: hypothetical protein F6K14_08880 [Symploca sp. SIO2C1]|nr:hypothetical protein [Symploca sp. SIO2C1]